MAQPPPYTRQYNFNDFQTTSPANPLPGVQVDNELNAAKTNLDGLNANIAKIQRDDGLLANQSVHKNSLDTDVLALIGLSGYTVAGDWAASNSYTAGTLVNFNDATYLATVAHTSGTVFATDKNAGKWILLANAAINTSASTVDKFEGTGSQTAFTLTYTYTSNTDVLVFVNGALRNPGDDYSISGNTITFSTAPSTPSVSGNENVIVWGPNVTVQAAVTAANTASSNASGFATAASNSATAAATSASSSATSAATSTTQANTSTTQAGNSATSAAAALSSQNAAAASQSAASTSETNAAASAATATTQAGLATTNGAAQVTLATAQVALATTQASNSASSAAASATSETNSANSASAASTSESNAAASAATATTQAGLATTQANNAAASLATFQGQYHGAASSDPTSNLDAGDLYFNTSTGVKVYTGSAWVDVKPSSSEQTNINTVAGRDTEIGLLGVSGVITNMGVLGTSDAVADMNSLAAISSDITSLAGALEKTYTVTVTNPGSGNIFVLDGSNNPTISLFRGNTYIFDQSDGTNSGHPIAFKDSGGSAYTTGVTTTGTPGSSGAKTIFEVPSTAPSSLLYYCTVHGNTMGNAITVTDSNISLVAGSIANVNLTGGSISNVNSVAAALTNINTTATNLSGVNSFAERYRVGSSDPTSSLDEGDLAYNSTASQLKYYDGSAWQGIAPGISAMSADSSPSLGGNLDTNGNDINFGDNDKAVFGAGSDLQIYHNASNGNSHITESGSGSLVINGDNLYLQNTAGTENYIVAVSNDAVTLYHDNSAKLATTSTGIDVTGDVLTDTVTLDNGANDWQFSVDASNNLIISIAGTAKAKLDSSGNLTVVGDITAFGTI